MSGAFSGTVDFGGGTAPLVSTTSIDDDAFVAHLDANGNTVWSQSYGGTGDQNAEVVAVDLCTDGPVVAGFMTGTMTLPSAVDGGTRTLTAATGNGSSEFAPWIARLAP